MIDLAGAAGMQISAVDDAGASIAGSSQTTGEYYHGQGFDKVETVSESERNLAYTDVVTGRRAVLKVKMGSHADDKRPVANGKKKRAAAPSAGSSSTAPASPASSSSSSAPVDSALRLLDGFAAAERAKGSLGEASKKVLDELHAAMLKAKDMYEGAGAQHSTASASAAAAAVGRRMSKDKEIDRYIKMESGKGIDGPSISKVCVWAEMGWCYLEEGFPAAFGNCLL